MGVGARRSPAAIQLVVGAVIAGDLEIGSGAPLAPLLESRVPVVPGRGAPGQHQAKAHGQEQQGAQRETGQWAWKPLSTMCEMNHGRSAGAVVLVTPWVTPWVTPGVTPPAMPVTLQESMKCARNTVPVGSACRSRVSDGGWPGAGARLYRATGKSRRLGFPQGQGGKRNRACRRRRALPEKVARPARPSVFPWRDEVFTQWRGLESALDSICREKEIPLPCIRVTAGTAHRWPCGHRAPSGPPLGRASLSRGGP